MGQELTNAGEGQCGRRRKRRNFAGQCVFKEQKPGIVEEALLSTTSQTQFWAAGQEKQKERKLSGVKATRSG